MSWIHSSSRWSSFTTKRMDARKYENWACIRSHNQLSKLQKMGLKFESGPWVKIILNLGSDLIERTNTWSIQITTILKFLQINMKIKRHNQVSRLLQPDQRQKQNDKRRNLLSRQVSYQCTKENGLTLSHRNQLSLHTTYRRKWSVFFDNQTVQREEDGAIQFYRIKFHLRNQYSQVQHWSDERWKSCLAAGGGSKRKYQYCVDNSGTILHLRVLQGHSGHNLIHLTLQNNVLIQRGIFHHIYHIGCAFNLHYHQQWIDTWRSRFEQKTNSILLAHWSKRQRS